MSTTNTVTAPPADQADVAIDWHDFATSSVTWVEGHWFRIAVAIGIATAIVLVLLSLRSLGRRLCDSGETLQWKTILGRVVMRTNFFFMVTLAAELVNGYADAPQPVDTTISFLFTIAAVFQGATWARELILGAVEHNAAGEGHSSEALGSAMGIIRLLVTLILFAVALIVVLDNLGVNVTGLVAGLGVGGLAIGLAARGIFADLFAALAIIFDRPFRRGDSISYDKTSGIVEEIGIKSTRIRSTTGEERIISNTKLLDFEIQNNSRRDRRRIKFLFGIPYDTDPEKAERIPAIMKEVVEANEMEFIRSGIVAFGIKSLEFEVEFDSPHADFQSAYDARHLIGLAILRRFDAEEIGFFEHG